MQHKGSRHGVKANAGRQGMAWQDKACAGQLHHRPVVLQRPCLALPCLVCLPLPWPHACCPCVAFAHFFVHYHVRQDHRALCRDCPVGSRITGLHWRPVHRLCSLRSFQRGRPRTACEQPGSLLFPTESIDPGPWCSV